MGVTSEDTKVSGLERTDKPEPTPQDKQKSETKLYQPKGSAQAAGEVVDFDPNTEERDLSPFIKEEDSSVPADLASFDQSKARENFLRPKTPEQLRQQVELTRRNYNLRPGVNSPVSWDDHPELDTPEKIKAAGRGSSEEERQLSGDIYYYTQALRQLRAEQRPHIEQQVTEAAPEQRSEAFLQSLNYEGPLQTKLLQRMQKEHGAVSLRDRLFTDEQVESAANDREKFLELVNEGLNRSPEAVFNAFDELKTVLSEEQLHSVLERVVTIQPEVALGEFAQIAPEFPHDEARRLFSESYSLSAERDKVIGVLTQPEVAALFEPEEIREMVLENFPTAPSYAVSPEVLNHYLDQGIISPDQARQFIIGLVSDQPYSIGYLDRYVPFFPEETQLAQLKGAVRAAFLEARIAPYELGKMELLGDDDRRGIVQALATDGNLTLLYSSDLMAAYLTTEQRTKLLQDAIRVQDAAVMQDPASVLKSELLTEPEKQAFLDAFLKSDAVDSGFDSLLGCLPEGEASTKLVRDLLDRLDPETALNNPEAWIKYISDNPAEQKKYLEKLILQINDFRFVFDYTEPHSGTLLKELFSDEDMRRLLYQQLELGVDGSFYRSREIRQLLGGDSAFREFVDKAIEADPYQAIGKLDEISYLFSSQEIKDLISRASADAKGTVACLYAIEHWGTILDAKDVWEFLQNNAESQGAHIVVALEKVLPFVPTAERAAFLDRIIKANPFAAIEEIGNVQLYRKGLSEESILQLAESDEEKLSLAPRTLKELFKAIRRTQDPVARNTILAEGKDFYYYLANIQRQGLAENLKAVLANPETTAKKEADLVTIFHCFSLLKEKDPERFAQLGNLGGSFEEASQILTLEIGRRMSLKGEVSQEQSRRFFETMQSPAPFLIYYLNFEDSLPHKEILTQMYEAILAGRYEDWKFGAGTQEALESLKQQRLLPAGLTLDQYDSWRGTSETTLHETLATDAGSVAREIQNILFDNTEHLDVDAFGLLGEKNLEEVGREVQVNLGRVGQQLAEVNKRMSALRGETGEGTEEYSALAVRRQQLQEERGLLVKNRNLVRLASLKPQEIVSGYFMEGEKRTGPIRPVLDEISSQIPTEGRFVVDRIKQVMADFYNQNQESQNLLATDSASPKILIEVGANPVGSCQHYAHGSYNECLLGYSDPDTKIMVLRNEKGNLVARSIFRLLPDQDGNPALHIERIYSAVSGRGVQRSIYTHAYRKAQEMGIPLYVSSESQDENGAELETDVPSGFETVLTQTILRSESSRAPKVYVDSAGGARSLGQFQMSRLFEVRPTL